MKYCVILKRQTVILKRQTVILNEVKDLVHRPVIKSRVQTLRFAQGDTVDHRLTKTRAFVILRAKAVRPAQTGKCLVLQPRRSPEGSRPYTIRDLL